MDKIKIVIVQNAGEDVKKLNHSYICSGNVKWQSYSGPCVAIS